MTGTAELRRLEQWMTYLRWFGVLFAVVSIVTQRKPPFPDMVAESWAWTLTMILAIGSLLIWGVLARVTDEQALRELGRAGFALDTLVIMGFVWTFTFAEPFLSWALLLILPLEGALRYRMRGALLATAFVGVFMLPEAFHYASMHDTEFDPNMLIFATGLSALIAGVSGTMAQNWHEKSRAYEQQSARLAELDRLKDRYLAITSHEIRGPLTAVIAGIQTMQKRADRLSEEKRKEMLDMVAGQSQQLARLVEDLMLSSELQAGSLALNTEWVEIEPVIQQALQAAAAKRKQHRLEMYVDPLRCEIDPARVSQLIRNLVENAYKYTPDQTRVSVTAKPTANGILLEVADDGPGIPADKRDQLFQAFARIEETAAGQEGVGLGLFVVSQLVNSMNGRIDFASSSRGTTFGIHIPCRFERVGPAKLDLVRGGEAG